MKCWKSDPSLDLDQEKETGIAFNDPQKVILDAVNLIGFPSPIIDMLVGISLPKKSFTRLRLKKRSSLSVAFINMVLRKNSRHVEFEREKQTIRGIIEQALHFHEFRARE